HECGRAASGRIRLGGGSGLEPPNYRLDLRGVRCFAPISTLGPSSHLAAYKTHQLFFCCQARGGDIGLVASFERIKQPLADSLSHDQIIADLRRHISSHHETTPALHQIKRYADDRSVVAEQIRLWRQIKMRMNRGQQPVLTRHVVSCWRYWSYWRSPQYEL